MTLSLQQVHEPFYADTSAMLEEATTLTGAEGLSGFALLVGVSPAISAIAAAIAAGISAWMAWQTRGFNRQQAAWKRAEKERTYYDAILVVPVLDALRYHRRAMGKALREGARSVHEAVARDAPLSEHRSAVDAVLDNEFTGLRDRLRDVLLEAAKDWNNGELLDRMQAELQRLEDEVTKEVLKLLSPEVEVNFEAVVNDVIGDIVRLVMEFDPALQATRKSASGLSSKKSEQ